MFYNVYIKCFIILVLFPPKDQSEINNSKFNSIAIKTLEKKFELPRKTMPIVQDYS